MTIILLKSFAIAFCFLYIKLLFLFTFIIFYFINIESKKILKKKFKIDENYYSNFCIRPKTLTSIPEYLPSTQILYIGLHNKVFNLTYAKILIGEENFWIKIIKNIKIKEIIKSILLWFIGINKFFLKLSIKIIKYNNESLEQYLFKIFNNPIDDRIIIKINDKWEINGSIEKTITKIENCVHRNISHQNFQSFKPKLYIGLHKIRKNFIELDCEYLFYKGKFSNINNKITHSHFNNITKYEWCYQTDFHKAYLNKFFNRDQIVYKYHGVKKDSSLLFIKEKEIKILSEPKLESCLRQVMGSILYGYNEEMVSIKFSKEIDEVKMLINEWNALLYEAGIREEKEYKEILKEFIEDIISK